MKKGDIIVQKSGSAIKYLVVETEKIGTSDIVYAIRVKFDKKDRDSYTTFGKERGMLASRFRVI